MNKPIQMGLLFLVAEPDVCQPKVWREFVDSAEGEIRLFCHPKVPIHIDSILAGNEIKESVWTQWGSVQLVRAMFALLRAGMQDSRLSHFVFVSESCVPIKSWKAVKKSLEQDSRSRLSVTTFSEMSWEHRSRKTSSNIAKGFWRLHSAWVTLNRETSAFLLAKSSTIREFEKVPCADEHAMGSILAIHGYDMTRIRRAQTTWTLWRGGSHPVTINSVNSELSREWRGFEGFCARKFSTTSDVGSLELHLR